MRSRAGLFAIWLGASLALHAAIGVAVRRAGKPSADPAPSTTAQGLTGETLETAPELSAFDPGGGVGGDREASAANLPPAVAGAPAEVLAPPAPAGTLVPRGSHETRPHGAAGAPGAPGVAGAAASEPGRYGAVGDRSAVDLATAFTRALPQIASTDPGWQRAALGSVGRVRITLVLDPDGRLVESSVGDGSPLLRASASRTIALVKARSFVARGARTTLELEAKISPDDVHDGLHGDVFALGASYMNPEGSAFFALAIGRRIDLHVRAR